MENLIKFLRESRDLSKSDVYKGIMSEYTYTNIETILIMLIFIV